MQAYTGLDFRLCKITLSQNATVRDNFTTCMNPVSRLSPNRNDSQHRSLIKLLCSFRACCSSDPRDKIYALVDLANDQGLHQMVPVDYAKSVEAVYLECAEFLVRNGDGMEMLEEAGILPPRDETSVGLNMPSWVPDWSRAIFTPINRQENLYRAAGETQPDMSCETCGISLHVRGIRIDVIGALAPKPDLCQHTIGFHSHNFAAWEQAVKEVARRSRFFEERFGHCAKSLGVGSYYKGGDKHFFSTVDSNDLWNNANYLLRAFGAANNHRFCVTRQGYMGWVPLSSQPGDLIIVLYGGPTPFTLRKTNGGYLLLGTSCLEGFMNGEALQLEDAVPEDFVLL